MVLQLRVEYRVSTSRNSRVEVQASKLSQRYTLIMGDRLGDRLAYRVNTTGIYAKGPLPSSPLLILSSDREMNRIT